VRPLVGPKLKIVLEYIGVQRRPLALGGLIHQIRPKFCCLSVEFHVRSFDPSGCAQCPPHSLYIHVHAMGACRSPELQIVDRVVTCDRQVPAQPCVSIPISVPEMNAEIGQLSELFISIPISVVTVPNRAPPS
jgi:hypothetical protein